MADYASTTSKSIPLSEYRKLIDSLTQDKKLVKKLEQDAIEREKAHKREIEEIYMSTRTTENGAKWVVDRNKDLEKEVEKLTKKLKHAMKVISDLHEDKTRSDPHYSLDEVDEEMYREVIAEALSRKAKGKAKAPRAKSSSSITTKDLSGDNTPRPSPSHRIASHRRGPSSSLLSPVMVLKRPGGPLNSQFEASTPTKPSQDLYGETHESRPWASEADSKEFEEDLIPSPSTISKPRTSSYEGTIFWEWCPKEVRTSLGPYTLAELKQHLKLSDRKLDSIRTLEQETGFRARLQLPAKKVHGNYRVAFIYRSMWFERSREVDGLSLVDWCLPNEYESFEGYLKKRDVTEEVTDDSPIFHVFSYMVDVEADSVGWWYIGGMRWQLVEEDALTRTGSAKPELLEKLANHLSERSNNASEPDDVIEMLQEQKLKQITIKFFPVEMSISAEFCLSVLGVEAEAQET